MNIRVGQGFDIHRFNTEPTPGRLLILGGEVFEGMRSLAGHSDADVVAHAVADALLGAAGLGDIGQHFPDTDPRWKGVNSVDLLQATGRLLSEAGWQIGNIDATVVAQAPKLAAHKPAMQTRIAQALGISTHQVNIKAKTAEKLGPVGMGQSIEARAVALIHRP